MKYILLLPAISNAGPDPFNKLPDSVLNKLTYVIDTACDNVSHKLDGNEQRAVFADMMNVIYQDVADMYKGFFPERKNFLDLCQMASWAAQGGYFQEDGYSEPSELVEYRNSRSSIEAAGLLTTRVLDNLFTYSYSRCRGEKLSDDDEMKWTHQQKAANAISLITAPLILKDVDVHRNGQRSAMTFDDQFGATQYIENKSSVEQTVTIQKNIEKKSTHLQSNTKGWSYEIGFSLTVTSDVKVGLYSAELSATASTSYGESGESTKEDSTEDTITESFTFNLVVPPCSALTGRVKVTRQTEEYDLTQTFELEGREVHIDGKIVERNAIRQEFTIFGIEELSSDECGVEKNTKDDCNEHHIDSAFEHIIPKGEFDWRCVDLQRRRVCTAICKNGEHKYAKAYKIQCPHNTTYWTQTTQQHALDCDNPGANSQYLFQ